MANMSNPNTLAPILGQLQEIPRGKVSASVQLTFPAGGIVTTDQKATINWAMSQYPFSSRVGGYIDVGATDPARDLDSMDGVIPLYLDNAIQQGFGPQLAGINPPKAIMLRCLVGSGLLYINVTPGGGGGGSPSPDQAKQTPFPLHAGVGLFYYTFPRRDPWRMIMTDPGDPTRKVMVPSCIVDMALRTFEASNRFQMEIFR